MTDLGGTRALVTGATSGLGLAMAKALVDAGARVAITSRDAERAASAAAGLGPTVLGLALDVRDERAVAAGVLEVWDRLGGIDLLVNNAGIGMRTVNPRFLSDPQPFWEVSPKGFRDAEVLVAAYKLRLERGDHHITEVHLADAIESLIQGRGV